MIDLKVRPSLGWGAIALVGAGVGLTFLDNMNNAPVSRPEPVINLELPTPITNKVVEKARSENQRCLDSIIRMTPSAKPYKLQTWYKQDNSNGDSHVGIKFNNNTRHYKAICYYREGEMHDFYLSKGA